MKVEIIRLVKATPFRAFAIVMDSGQRVLIRHPENVAYDPVNETLNCYVISDGVMHILPWANISSLAFGDQGQPLPMQA